MTSRTGLYDPARALQRPSCALTGFAVAASDDRFHDRHQDRPCRQDRHQRPYEEHQHQELTAGGTNRHRGATGCIRAVSREHLHREQQRQERRRQGVHPGHPGHQDDCHQDHPDDQRQGRGCQGHSEVNRDDFHPEEAESAGR
jgi:hypothetical protein